MEAGFEWLGSMSLARDVRHAAASVRDMNPARRWKYVNVRCPFIFLEHSIERGIESAVFEPNGERLWQRVSDAAPGCSCWRSGATALCTVGRTRRPTACGAADRR
jgi:hypothetical protein